MDKSAAVKKEQEKKNLQYKLSYLQLLIAIFLQAEYRYQQKINHEKKIKKFRRFLLKNKKKIMQKKHLQHLNSECYGLAAMNAHGLSKHGFFSNENRSSNHLDPEQSTQNILNF